MTFDSEIIEDQAEFLDFFADATNVTYNPFGGTPVSRQAVILVMDDLEINRDDGNFQNLKNITIEMAKSATLGVLIPSTRDTITIESVEWSIVAIQSNDAAFFKLSLERGVTVEYGPRQSGHGGLNG